MGQKKLKLILFIGLLCTASTLVLPLWDIAIFAPQYPEGLALEIWLDKIGGDLRNINILNHYVGMRVISPSDIPELLLFPKIVMGLLGIGLFSVILTRIWSVAIYFLSFSAFSVYALYDFWKWEYEYGHNLSPDAPIKVPGMTYQPPLFGTETLLNISIYSYPSSGGWLMVVGYGSVAFVLGYLLKKSFKRETL